VKDLVDAFSGLTVATLAKLILAFVVVDILRKLVVPKIVERVLARGFTANEIARLALVDVLGFLRRAELLVLALLADERALRANGDPSVAPETARVRSFGDLAFVGSEYRLVAPSLSKEKLLEAFAGEEIQRCATIMFECYQRFSIRSADNREAFYWLLDHHDAWLSPQPGPSAQVRERLILLNDARRRMRTYLFEILAHGYRLSELLCEEASSVWTLRGSFEEFEKILRKLRALDANGIRWRRAFYAVRDRGELFDEQSPMALVRWNDELARGEPDALAEVRIDTQRTSRCLRLPAMTEVALPVGTIAQQRVRIVRERRRDETLPIAAPLSLTATRDLTNGARDLQLIAPPPPAATSTSPLPTR